MIARTVSDMDVATELTRMYSQRVLVITTHPGSPPITEWDSDGSSWFIPDARHGFTNRSGTLSHKFIQFLDDVRGLDQIHDAGEFDTLSPAKFMWLFMPELMGGLGIPVNT